MQMAAFPYHWKSIICLDKYTISISKCVYEGFGANDTKITYEGELQWYEYDKDKENFKPPILAQKIEGADALDVFSCLLNMAYKMAHERN